ncbi:hypothetical protein FV141_09195 [Dermacoccus abyssi]|uniref:Uncharacterized protein n=1 Tax=Dermacoccus abyssi TaxID=322596 RepID=A0ABX5ZA05_9MICO|nr:hypothetical protein FV141_09195 [Dermacoccus abyssi]
MRMDRLLADLEAAEAARRAAEKRLEIAEGVRAERAAVTLEDRLRGALGSAVEVVAAGHPVRGRLVEVGSGWVALDRSSREAVVLGVDDLARPGSVIVATAAIESVTGLRATHVKDEAPSVGRTWGSVLRAIGRSRATVVWRTTVGNEFTGLVDAVGVDHAVVRRSAGSPVVLTTQAVACVEVGARRGEDYR